MIKRKLFLTHYTGASGITGWAIVNVILNGYPEEGAFQSVTALTNRPLNREKSQWPSSKKLQVVSGLDLLTEKGQEGLEEDMKLKIKNVDKVTHVYYFGENDCEEIVFAILIYCKHILWTQLLQRRFQSTQISLTVLSQR
jgi:hypothetical protein